MTAQTAVFVPNRLRRAAMGLACLMALQALTVLASCQAELSSPVPARVYAGR